MMVKCFMKHGHKAVLWWRRHRPDWRPGRQSRRAQSGNHRRKLPAIAKAIVDQYRQLFGGQNFEVVDNHDWFKSMSYLDFLRDVGKHVPMRQMLARDFVQKRVWARTAAASATPNSATCLYRPTTSCAYEDKGVTLQVCGSDQWGNTIAGVDLIRRNTGGEAHVFSAPLVVNQTTGKNLARPKKARFGWTPARPRPPVLPVLGERG